MNTLFEDSIETVIDNIPDDVRIRILDKVVDASLNDFDGFKYIIEKICNSKFKLKDLDLRTKYKLYSDVIRGDRFYGGNNIKCYLSRKTYKELFNAYDLTNCRDVLISDGYIENEMHEKKICLVADRSGKFFKTEPGILEMSVHINNPYIKFCYPDELRDKAINDEDKSFGIYYCY
jgi:hypothetical protein